MLCYVMLCYVMLCYITLCYITLHYIILYSIILYCIVSPEGRHGPTRGDCRQGHRVVLGGLGELPFI